MNKLKLLTISVFAIIILVMNSCQRQPVISNTDTSGNSEALTKEQLAVIDTMSSQTVDLHKIILPNGAILTDFMNEYDSIWFSRFAPQTIDPYTRIEPNIIKTILCGKFLTFGRYLTTRGNFIYPNEGQGKPAQNGLAYSYGAKDYNIRMKPPFGQCTDALYGLDCAGLLYQIFFNAGLNVSKTVLAVDQHQSSYLQIALHDFPSMNNFIVVNKGKLNVGSFESGDIIYWTMLDGKSASHIGIILKDIDGNLKIYQSNGTDDASNHCETNYGMNRGPRTLNLSDAYWLSSGASWEIVRMEIKNNSGGTTNSNGLQIGGCYGTGACGIDVNGNILYPCGITAKACGGNPPFVYKLGNNAWSGNFNFIIYTAGSYTVTVRDNLGFYAYRTYIFH